MFGIPTFHHKYSPKTIQPLFQLELIFCKDNVDPSQSRRSQGRKRQR